MEEEKGTVDQSVVTVKPRKLDPVAYMSRHFVALCCDYDLFHADGSFVERKRSVYSGFLIQIHGVFFWVTAGHCFKDEMDAGLKSGQIRMIGGSFMDYFNHEATHHHPIPYTYELGDSFYIEQPEYGLDFALLKLNDLQVLNFAANKLVAISRINWEQQHRLTFDFHRMLGIPSDRVFTTLLPDGGFDTQVGQAMVGLHKIDLAEIGELPPGVDEPPSDDWFIGRLDAECIIRSLKGMSGGPIFGFRKDSTGALTYHVVALQSRWWPSTRTIFGCSLPLFAEEVYRQLGAVIAEFEKAE